MLQGFYDDLAIFHFTSYMDEYVPIQYRIEMWKWWCKSFEPEQVIKFKNRIVNIRQIIFTQPPPSNTFYVTFQSYRLVIPCGDIHTMNRAKTFKHFVCDRYCNEGHVFCNSLPAKLHVFFKAHLSAIHFMHHQAKFQNHRFSFFLTKMLLHNYLN